MRVAVAVTGPDADAARALLIAEGHGVRPADEAGRCDLVVVDEWTPETAPVVQEARRRGVPVTVLAEMILNCASGPVVAITGTAGKTSTARALETILNGADVRCAISHTARSSNAWPDHSLAGGIADGAVLIAELTSTHLCHMHTVHPDVAVITLLRPDHVELHGDLDGYFAAKRRIIAEQDAADCVVVPWDDAETTDHLGATAGRAWWFGEGDPVRPGAFIVDGGILLRGASSEEMAPTPLPHGPARRAIAAAAASALALGVDPARIAHALPAIEPVPHRFATSVTADGVTIIDDSMAATPLKALEGIRAVAGRSPVIVIGGDDALAGAPVHMSPEEAAMLREAAGEARAVARVIVAFGPAAERIRPYVTPDLTAPDIGTALLHARSAAGRDGVVLVSPMFPMRPDERMAVAAAAL